MENETPTSKSQLQESGQTHSTGKIIGLIFLVTLLLGTIGAGAWWYGSSQAQKEADAKIAELEKKITSLESINSADKTSNGKTLQLTDWGIEIPLKDDSSVFTVAHDRDEPQLQFYYVTSKLAGCWVDDKDVQKPADAGVGVMSRLKKNEKISREDMLGTDGLWVGKTWEEYYASRTDSNFSAHVTIGDYIYAFSPPQQACDNPDTDSGKEANNKQEKLTEEFVALFKNLRTTVARN